GSALCKSHVLRRFMNSGDAPDIKLTWVIGDNRNDLALMRMADRAFAIDPKVPELKNDPRIEVIQTFSELTNLLPETEEAGLVA
ncbi:MAG: hypothetical protein ACO26U_11980, partial [Burkholderiaceae bacterium]